MKREEQSLHLYLVKQGRLGDRRAQSELYQRYAKAMYNICRRMMGDSDEAKDVLQDAFVHAFSEMHKLQNESAFPAWMKRIVVNHCLNALKKKVILFISEDAIPDVPLEDQDFSDEKELRVEQMLRAMDKLSEGCRAVLNLYAFEGYDHKEIAQILSISEEASKSQYSKAKRRIKELIRREKEGL